MNDTSQQTTQFIKIQSVNSHKPSVQGFKVPTWKFQCPIYIKCKITYFAGITRKIPIRSNGRYRTSTMPSGESPFF